MIQQFQQFAEVGSINISPYINILYIRAIDHYVALITLFQYCGAGLLTTVYPQLATEPKQAPGACLRLNKINVQWWACII